MNSNCSNSLDLRNVQEQVRKAFCHQTLFWPFAVRINCSSDLKMFANSRPSASNFKSFSRSLEQFFLTVGENNFDNKIPLFHLFTIIKFQPNAYWNYPFQWIDVDGSNNFAAEIWQKSWIGSCHSQFQARTYKLEDCRLQSHYIVVAQDSRARHNWLWIFSLSWGKKKKKKNSDFFFIDITKLFSENATIFFLPLKTWKNCPQSCS